MFQFGGQRKDGKDFAKDVKRESRRAKREIDRESRDMEREEAQLQADIKRYAAKGEHASARRLAKELVQLRNAKERAVGMKSAVGAMATRATTMAASQRVAKSIGSAAKAMAMANAGINPVELQRTMQQFAAHDAAVCGAERADGDDGGHGRRHDRRL